MLGVTWYALCVPVLQPSFVTLRKVSDSFYYGFLQDFIHCKRFNRSLLTIFVVIATHSVNSGRIFSWVKSFGCIVIVENRPWGSCGWCWFMKVLLFSKKLWRLLLVTYNVHASVWNSEMSWYDCLDSKTFGWNKLKCIVFYVHYCAYSLLIGCSTNFSILYWWLMAHNPFKMKCRPLYLKTRFVPCSKYFSARL
jgi:hypothetical protein